MLGFHFFQTCSCFASCKIQVTVRKRNIDIKPHKCHKSWNGFQSNLDWAEAIVVGGKERAYKGVKSDQEMTHALYPTTKALAGLVSV